MPVKEVEQVKVGQDDAGTLEVTLKGEATALITALVHGLPREALIALQAKLQDEIQVRSRD